MTGSMIVELRISAIDRALNAVSSAARELYEDQGDGESAHRAAEHIFEARAALAAAKRSQLAAITLLLDASRDVLTEMRAYCGEEESDEQSINGQIMQRLKLSSELALRILNGEVAV